MSKRTISKKNNGGSEFFDWMLAIDFDPVKYGMDRGKADSIAKILFS